LRILAAVKDLSTLSITEDWLYFRPLSGKMLTGSVYGRSLAQRWFPSEFGVEKLRKALEKRADDFGD